ncbi:MAG: hypothetical protein ACK4MV_19410 [Beijerinckiaceae bacterium]
MLKSFSAAAAAALIAAAVAAPASAQIAPGRTLDPAARVGDALTHQVNTKKKKSAKKTKSNVRSKSYSWQSVRGSSRPVYLPNGRGMR